MGGVTTYQLLPQHPLSTLYHFSLNSLEIVPQSLSRCLFKSDLIQKSQHLILCHFNNTNHLQVRYDKRVIFESISTRRPFPYKRVIKVVFFFILEIKKLLKLIQDMFLLSFCQFTIGNIAFFAQIKLNLSLGIPNNRHLRFVFSLKNTRILCVFEGSHTLIVLDVRVK